MPANTEKKISALVETLYETAVNPAPRAWHSVLKEMAHIFASGPASITLYSPADDCFEVVATTYSEAAIKSFNERFRLASTVHPGIIRMRPGDRFWRIRDRPNAEFLKSDVYRNFFKKEGVYDLVYSVLFRGASVSAGISFSRSSAKTAFHQADLDAMDMLLPHLRRALKMYLSINEVRRENLRMTETLSKIPRSVLFVDSSQRVAFSNDAGTRTLASRDGLEVDRNGMLFASVTKENRQLRAILDSVFEPATKRSIVHHGVFTVSRPSGLRPMQVLISPFSARRQPAYSAERLALLFIYDPERTVEPVEPLLCQMYGLTAAEARIAALIAEGVSLGEAASLLSIKPDTVRTHLKRIFSKTRTHRQGDLISLILNSPAILKNV